MRKMMMTRTMMMMTMTMMLEMKMMSYLQQLNDELVGGSCSEGLAGEMDIEGYDTWMLVCCFEGKYVVDTCDEVMASMMVDVVEGFVGEE